MKRKNKYVKKPWFFVVALLVIVFTAFSFFGADSYYGDNRNVYVKGAGDIRWGIDISGGVEAIFAPDLDTNNDGKDDVDPDSISDSDMDSAKQVIETRMLYQNITDYEVYTDYDNKQIIVRFPWQSNDESYDPTAAIKELGDTAMLTFYKGANNQGEVVLKGAADIKGASYAGYHSETKSYVVSLELTETGKAKFAAATAAQKGKQIAIYMDNTLLSAPTVDDPITDGNAIITGMTTDEEAMELAQKINAGALPFALTIDDSKLQVISPTLGNQSLKVMLYAGIIAFAIICIMMIFRYRLPGIIACVALAGQAGGMIACVSGFFSSADSFTMTLPGIAGIILSIGFGVDANVITSERIKEEFKKGKTIDGAISQGYSNAFSSILDGNITNVIVALVLLAAFGAPDSILGKIFSFLFPFLSSSVTGNIYSFGYTLIMGVIFNFIMAIFASRVMLMGISRFKAMRNPWLYGADKPNKPQKPSRLEKVDFVKSFKKVSIVVVAILLVGVVLTSVLGIGFDINFAGGSRFTYSYTGEVNTANVKQLIVNKLGVEPAISETTDYSTNETKLVISFAGDITQSVDQTKLEAVLKEAAADKKAETETSSNSSATTSTNASTNASTDASTNSSTTTSTESTTSSTTTSTESTSSSTTSSTVTSSGTSSSTTSSKEEEVTSESMVDINNAIGFLLEKNFADNKFKSLDANTVNPTLAGAFLGKSLFAVGFAALLIVAYIGIRFRKVGGVSAAVAAFIALLHDCIIAFFACVIFGLDIDTNFFAVVLTLLGYSLNATIVIFDRVRENKKFYPDLTVGEQVNKSIKETFARSIFTSLTTIASILSIVVVGEFFGVTALRTFAIPMCVGVIAGCFSSICIAGPLWVKWKNYLANRPKKDNKNKSKAKAR
ncbi:MAG: SecD/SecF family protein translocase subunit [Clostridia bacterium]|nr:SecD/SecF family protein translocase subunit [Clostridia bacterium]